ncbi:alpha/beta hydrolase [Tardiphaga sp. 862_B3_N4_1]|uniref:alpha/beta hydrolase n=1 Tax=Tardiphaga sp. 862_B3_N4_1 TaxID=3240764 RepID=UPI003F277AF4
MQRSIRVRFATNRNRVNNLEIFGSDFFGSDGKRYITGSINVVQQSNKPDTGWYPDHTTLVLDEPTQSGKAKAPQPNDIVSFARDRATAQKLRKTGSEFGTILIPGFNSTFISALHSAAQIADAYGAVECYCISWPSNGQFGLKPYRSDQTKAQKSGTFVADVLTKLLVSLNTASSAQKPRLNLVAHSMGNRALSAAMQIIREKTPKEITENLFEGAVLAASDVPDNALSKSDQLAPLVKLAKRVTTYYAGGDLALTLSNAVNSWTPLGLGKPRSLELLPKTVTTVDCSDVATTYGDDGKTHHRHQYYRCSAWVINDVMQVLAGVAPNKIEGRKADVAGGIGGRAWWIPYDTESLSGNGVK